MGILIFDLPTANPAQGKLGRGTLVIEVIVRRGHPPNQGLRNGNVETDLTVPNGAQTTAEHHRKRSFEEEFVAFLNKHGVEYDPQYAWG